MPEAVLSLGSNSGDRLYYINRMEEMLQDGVLTSVRVSDLMETEPVDVFDIQPWYLNRVIAGWYPGSAAELLDTCLMIERSLGRIGKGTRGKRTADIDILLFGFEVIATEFLTIPHPAILTRRFCLEGLYRIVPDMIIPPDHTTAREYHGTMSCAVRGQRLRFPERSEGKP